MNWERIDSARRWGTLHACHPLARPRVCLGWRLPASLGCSTVRAVLGSPFLGNRAESPDVLGLTDLRPPARGRGYRIRHRVRLDVEALPRAHEVRGGPLALPRPLTSHY